MSVTIDSLDIQIRSSAGSAAANIDRLATSLQRLRDNSSLTKVSNNLAKLSVALRDLQVNSSTLSSIKGLAGAMKSLSSVQKASGLNSVLNSLKKLPDIVAALNPAQITAFSTAMRQLATGMAPLGTQIEKISRGFASLPARVSQCVTATNRLASATRSADNAQEDLDDSLDGTQLTLAAVISNIESYMQVLNAVVLKLKEAISVAIEWDGIQYRFGQAFGEDAQATYDWILKINEALGISVQEFMQYSGIYASLLKGFGVNQAQVTEISVGLTELTYDIWAYSNDRYKNLEDAAEAVRSAITGEIEPIRNAGIALTEASLQEYLDSIGMAHVSMEKLTEAQKAEVRYAVMVNSAMNQGIVGTYAREMDTAEGAVRRLSQQLKTLTQAFGSLFIPILQMAVPWITAFVDILTDAVHWLAALFGVKIMKIDWSGTFGAGASGLEDMAAGADSTAGSLKDAANAAKKMKDYALGFDELNVIDPTSASGGAGGAGGAGGTGGVDGGLGLDTGTLWDQALLDAANKRVDEIKEKVLDFFEEWKTELAIIGGALATLGISKLLGNLGEALGLGNNFLGVMKNIGKMATTAIVITLQYTLISEFLENYIDGEGFKEYVKAMLVAALGTWVLYSMWGPAGLVIGLSVTAVASLKAAFADGDIDSGSEALTLFTGLAAAAGALGIAWKKVVPGIKKVLDVLEKVPGIIKAAIGSMSGNSAATSALTFLTPNHAATISKITTAFSGAAKAAGTFIGGLSAGTVATVAAVIAAIASAAYFLYENWDKVRDAFQKFFETNIVPKLESIKESWEKMKSAVADILPESVLQWFKDAGKWIGDLIEKIGEWFKSVDWLKAIGTAFEWLGGVVFAAFSTTVSGVFSVIVGVIENFVQVISGIVQVVSGVVEAVVALFTGDLQGAWDAVKKIGSGIADVFKGLWGLVVDPIKNFVQGVIDWFTALWDELVGHSIVPDMIDDIVEWFLSLPGKIFRPLQDFVNGVIQKFKDMWSKIKSWFKSEVAPKFTLDYWKKKFDTIKSAISTKLQEFKSAASTKWTEIKRWYSSNVAPKFTLTFWLDKFSNLKEGFTKTIKNAVNSGIDLLNRFIGWINEKLNFSWDGLTIAGKTVYQGGSVQLFTIPTIPKLEKGGILEDGLFTMNRGEIAGKFNNGKSVVANNQMIVEGIAAGVYQAVVAAMNETQRRDSNVNVYLDGKKIYASVKKTESERGVSVMGSQLGYVY